MKDTAAEAQPPSRLTRALGPLMATAVVVGTVIGSGIFKKPQSIAENVHFSGLTALVWVLGGLVALLGALSLAEVATLFPKAGGNYVFLREGYGRLFGFLWGWVEFWIIRSASIAALATVFSESFNAVLSELLRRKDALGDPGRAALTVAVIWALALLNVRGVRWGGVVQVLITSIKVASLLGILLLPFVAMALLTPGSEAAPRADRLSPWWPDDWAGVNLAGLGTALLGVYWAYHGWMNIAPVAEEVRNPQRNIPLALLAGVGIVIFLYLGANLAYHLTIPRAEMAEMRNTPVATEFCLRLLGPVGAMVGSAAIMCSVFGALNGNLMVGPRLLFAMGEDGLAPRILGAVHRSYRTPALAIVVFAAWSAILVLAVNVLTAAGALPPNKSHFDRLTDFAMFGALIFETLAVLSIFVFRWRMPHAERPYRCWGYPVVPVLYTVVPALVVGNMFLKQTVEALAGVGFIGLGVVVYLLLPRGAGRGRLPEAP
jgi:basic amino acid/polyamine antiporter, APA family